MVALVNLAPAVETVSIGGQQVEVPGISTHGVAVLLRRFPELQAYLVQQQQEITAERLLQIVPDGIGAIIAAGCGYPGDADAEAVASRLPMIDQLALLEAVRRVTLPKGLGPFVERLLALAKESGVEGLDRETPATRSPVPSNS